MYEYQNNNNHIYGCINVINEIYFDKYTLHCYMFVYSHTFKLTIITILTFYFYTYTLYNINNFINSINLIVIPPISNYVLPIKDSIENDNLGLTFVSCVLILEIPLVDVGSFVITFKLLSL